jgi:hypothetical protein
VSRKLARCFQATESRHFSRISMRLVTPAHPPMTGFVLTIVGRPGPSSGENRPACGTGQRLRRGARVAPMAAASK